MNISQQASAVAFSATDEPSNEDLFKPNKSEQLKLELKALAEREPNEIDVQLELNRMKTEFGVTLTLLRKEYDFVKQAYQQSKQDAQITDEQRAADNAKFAQIELEKKLAEQRAVAEAAAISARAEALQKIEQLLPVFHKHLTRAGYLCDEDFAATLLMTHGARLLETSSLFCFYGSSGSGKSDGVLKASRFLPPELVLTITSMSEQAMNYLGDLQNRYVMLGEIAPQVDGQDDHRQVMMRQLISENKISRAVVDSESSSIVWKETLGPCVITATTTKEPSKFNDELQNRASWVVSNDSEEITAAVLNSIATRAQNPVRSDDTETQLELKAFQEFHRTLKSFPVSVPFAQIIKPVNTHVTVRRLANLVLNYVRANALLHQHVRKRDVINDVEVVVAEPQDYEVAYRVLSSAAPRVLEMCTKKEIQKFQDVLKPALQTAGRPLSTSDIARLLKEPPSNVYRWLSSYVKDGLLLRIDGSDSRRHMYKLNPDNVEFTSQDLGLVHPSVLTDPLAAHRAAGWAL